MQNSDDIDKGLFQFWKFMQNVYSIDSLISILEIHIQCWNSWFTGKT